MEKEHFEVILEDMNSKFNLLLENFQSLRDKMDEYNLDSIRRDEEKIKLLKFAKEDSDRRNDETNRQLKLAKEDLGKRIDDTNQLLKLAYDDLSKKIQENGLKITENRTLIEQNGEKLELLGEKQYHYERRLAQLEKRITND
ncbi:MAG: Heptapeptide repeat protein [Parcubacteria bacterium 34_609]|nr:MAG: Heptapeptide repeat protein [Parcubacteria bacterium 34_609]